MTTNPAKAPFNNKGKKKQDILKQTKTERFYYQQSPKEIPKMDFRKMTPDGRSEV